MDAGENDLFRAAVERELNILDHIGDGSAPRFAARDSGDAKRALIIATVLHFDEGARAAMQTGERDASERFKVERRKGEG